MRSDAITRYLTYRPRKVGGDTIFPISMHKINKALLENGEFSVEKIGRVGECVNAEKAGVFPSVSEAFKRLFFVPKPMEQKECREINALVALEANGLVGNGVQRGCYGFCNADGDMYVITHKMACAEPDFRTNKFNAENLGNLVKTIAIFDRPDRYWNHKKPFRLYNPVSIPMHNGLKSGCVLISDNNAGIVGFRELDFIRLKDMKDGGKNLGLNVKAHFSDISGVPSNLRNFEACSLAPYMESMGKSSQEARKLFEDYLLIKSRYHGYMGYSFLGTSVKNFESVLGLLFQPFKDLMGLCHNVKFKHLQHEKMLKNPSEEVVKAEAIKIQVARFIHLALSDSSSRKASLNSGMINDYITKSAKFFDDMCKTSKGASKVYWQDCKDLLADWKSVFQNVDFNFDKGKHYLTLDEIVAGAK